MSSDRDVDRLLSRAFEQPSPAPGPDFDEAVINRLGNTLSQRRRRPPAVILTAYWVAATVLAVLVLASLDWTALDSTETFAVVVLGLSSVVAPVVILARLAGVRFSEVLFQTVED